MRFYTELVSLATGLRDESQCEKVEAVMREMNPTLDYLSSEDFARQARLAAIVVDRERVRGDASNTH